MADLSDVETSLAAAIVQVIYPGGTEVPSIVGHSVKIFRGWPSPIGLNADLAANVASISIFSDPKTTRETTRYPRVWRTSLVIQPSIEVTVNGRTATLSGSGGAGQVVGLRIGSQTISIPVSATDTPVSLAAILATLVPGAISSGATVSFPQASLIEGRVVGSGSASMETRRQEQGITVSVWCSDPTSRDEIAGSLDSALSLIDWLTFSDGSTGLLRYKETLEVDTSENANLYRRDLVYTIEYPTIVTQTSSQMIFGIGYIDGADPTPSVSPNIVALRPKLGAIRFDAWYDPTDTIDQQCAAALSQPAWYTRSPPNAVVTNGQVSWPLAEQAVLDSEILAAVRSGLDFWAFDSFKPGGGLNRALSLYLSSSLQTSVQFCMLGQSSNWADPSGVNGYSDVIDRDVSLMSHARYLRVLDGRPVYFVLDASSSQTALLPGAGVQQAISYIRQSAIATGAGNPYIIWLSGAAFAIYNNVPAAVQVGADAAGAYASPRVAGTPENFMDLVATTESDWTDRSLSGLDMVATGMTGWDQRPLIEAPQPFYPIPAGVNVNDYYDAGTPQQIAEHVGDLLAFTASHTTACPSGLALIYAWNELVEGGWLMPTWSEAGPDTSRVDAVGLQVGAWSSTQSEPASFIA